MPACINHLPMIGWILQPKSLVVMAEPMTGNSSLRSPLPEIEAGRGDTANTVSRRNVAEEPASKAFTGTEIGGSGVPSKPRLDKPVSVSSRPFQTTRGCRRLLRRRTATPLLHSCCDSAPLLQACWKAGTSMGRACSPVSSWRRSSGVMTRFRSRDSSE